MTQAEKEPITQQNVLKKVLSARSLIVTCTDRSSRGKRLYLSLTTFGGLDDDTIEITERFETSSDKLISVPTVSVEEKSVFPYH